MQCDLAREHLAERLTGPLPADVQAALDAHLDGCAACRAETEELAATWALLDRIPVDAPDSGRMRARVDDLIAVQSGRGAPRAHGTARVLARPFAWLTYAAAATLLVATGVGLGRATAPRPEGTGEIAAMRDELRDVRQMMTLTLMQQQQSASDRLKGVMWAQALEQPDNAVATALLDTLMHDSNVNVRLATIDALARFAERDAVRAGAVRALAQQTSPLVQIALIDFLVSTDSRDAAEALRALSTDATVQDAVRARATDAMARLKGAA